MTIQDKHKKAASAKWKKAQVQSGKTSEPTKPPTPSTSTRPSRPLHLANPLPSGKQDSDDLEEDDDVEEEEAIAGASKRDDSDESDDASGSRFRRRQLVSNQARYEEKDDVVIPGEEEESDGEASHELEQLTAFMTRQRLALESSSSSSSPLGPAASSIPEDDIDHSLRGLGSGSSARRTTKEKSQVRVGEGSLVEMSAERAKADALSDVKARLLAGRDSGAKRRTGRVEVSKKPASSKTPSHQADDVDDFLDLIS